jgi:transposase
MHTKINTQKELIFKSLPKKVSRRDFNHYSATHLKKPFKGPKPKLSLYKIFNYILYVLHTGIQWDQLKTRKNELRWSNVYKWHNRWSKDGSYQRLFEASVIHLKDTDQLDTSILHGDGSNTVVKKGDQESVIQAISTRRGKKS